MTDPSSSSDRVSPLPASEADATHQKLLGFACASDIRGQVVDALDALSDNNRSLVYDWAMFPVEELPFWAHDRMKAYREQDPQRENPIAQEALNDYFNGLAAWFDFVKSSDLVPVLEPIEAEDGVGEEIEMLQWTIMPGGISDQLTAEQIEHLAESVERYREFALGTRRIVMSPETVYSRLPRETRDEKARREVEKLADSVISLLRFLAPAIEANRELFEQLGIDPYTGEPVESASS